MRTEEGGGERMREDWGRVWVEDEARKDEGGREEEVGETEETCGAREAAWRSAVCVCIVQE